MHWGHKTMLYDKLVELYLDYRNNYLTVAKFAEHHMISVNDAHDILIMGAKYMDKGPEL